MHSPHGRRFIRLPFLLKCRANLVLPAFARRTEPPNRCRILSHRSIFERHSHNLLELKVFWKGSGRGCGAGRENLLFIKGFPSPPPANPSHLLFLRASPMGEGPRARMRSVKSRQISAQRGPIAAERLNISTRSGSILTLWRSFFRSATRFLAFTFPSRKWHWPSSHPATKTPSTPRSKARST